MKLFVLFALFVFTAISARADQGQVVCANSDINGGMTQAVQRLNQMLQKMNVKTISTPVLTEYQYYATACVAVTK